jgi:hypothetical protein
MQTLQGQPAQASQKGRLYAPERAYRRPIAVAEPVADNRATYSFIFSSGAKAGPPSAVPSGANCEP